MSNNNFKKRAIFEIYLVYDLIHLLMKIKITNVSLMVYRILFKRSQVRLNSYLTLNVVL